MTTLTPVAQGVTTFGPGRVQTIALPERFDVHEVPRFDAMIDLISATGPVVVIDASEIRYMDRHAIDRLVDARLRCMDRGGDLTLAAPSVAARVILELSGRYEALNPIETVSGESSSTWAVA